MKNFLLGLLFVFIKIIILLGVIALISVTVGFLFHVSLLYSMEYYMNPFHFASFFFSFVFLVKGFLFALDSHL